MSGMMVSRRGFLKALGCSAALAATPGVVRAMGAMQRTTRPNVVFFYVDDLGRGMLSWYARRRAELANGADLGGMTFAEKLDTPHIDALLDGGLAFTNAHGCMYCAPARASLLTGYSDCHGERKFRISRAGQFVNAMQGLDYTKCSATDIEARMVKKEAELDKQDVKLAADDPYLAQVFQRAGYKTAQVCKMDYGFTVTRTQLRNHGWDAYYGYTDHALCHGFFPPYLVKKEVDEPEGRIVKLDGNTDNGAGKSIEDENYKKRLYRWDTAGKTGGYAPEVCHKWALNWMAERKEAGTPFFLFYSTVLPHGPVQIPASGVPYTGAGATPTTQWPRFDPQVTNRNSRIAFWRNADGKNLGKEPQRMNSWLDDGVSEGQIGTTTDVWNPAKNELTYLEAEYASMVRMLDQQLGDLVQKVKDLGLEDDTMFIFTSDNGHELYIKQSNQERNRKGNSTVSENFRDPFDGNNGQYGLKWHNWEGGIRVPLAVYWPGQISHRVVTDVVANYDWAKTFACMFGVNVDQKDGRDLNPLIFTGEHLPPQSYIVAGSTYGPCIITNDGWKLRCNKQGKEEQLFNLTTDYRERTNLATQPEQIERVKWMYDTLMMACDKPIRYSLP